MKIISLTLSLARIFATFGIYMFHVLSQFGVNNHNIDFISILVFCFLTGFLSSNVKLDRYQWLKKRVFSIMLPYWLVIIPVLLANRVVCYKETTLFEDLVTFWGGNMFLKNKVYVIAWYITFILLIYLFTYFQSLYKNLYFKIIVWAIGFCIFSLWLNKEYYFLSFAIGFLISTRYPVLPGRKNNKTYLENKLFSIQSHCYCFFLIHGGVLVALCYFLHINIVELFLYGMLLSVFGAITLKKAVKLVQRQIPRFSNVG
ncbi:acyltransferase family protein [uncultured Desulfobacter sp.]|uniref:acyltransferase family protein n=1 Tax=uncultured Desulfobacter sp. TaxID=240139 RepID=UPI0029F52795|nr:acyltransferase family protein [uncultured Desulfobacter sp.]